MESLLSHAFDNLSSKILDKNRKGIKQIEGLLAQICLSKTASQNHQRRASALPTIDEPSPAKTLKNLPEDPAFREFFRLQEGFEYNVATHLLTTLNALLSHPPGTADSHLSATLSLLQGILLLHPPSRTLFTSPSAMDTLLDLLDPANPPSVQQSAILVLVTALLNNPRATRTFENADGLLSISEMLHSDETSKSVKVAVMEFLYFYLMPEAPLPTSSQRNAATGHGTALRVKPSTSSFRSSSAKGRERVSLYEEHTSVTEYSSVLENSGMGGRGYDESGSVKDRTIKSTREKQRLLGQHLSNVDDLVEDLRESNLFDA